MTDDFKKITETEEGLESRKWFDYKWLSPDTATLACALAYGKAAVHHMNRMGDRGDYIDLLQKLDVQNIQGWKYYPQMTKLRRFADYYGICYASFWSFAFAGAEKLKSGTILPMYFLKEGFLRVVQDQDKKDRDAFLRYADSRLLMADVYVGAPLQKEYGEYLLAELQKLKGDKVAFLRGMIADGKISEKFLRSRVSKRLG